MIVIDKLNQIRRFKDPVVALGVFDGLHRGHRLILESVARKARRIKGTGMVLTFYPHPRRQESLYSLKHRLRLISELGIDVCVVINFNPAFAGLSPESFIFRILVEKIGCRFVYVGENFRFGKHGSGDCGLLADKAKEYKFGLKVFKVVESAGRPVSSTVIRKLIKKARLKDAEKLLGRKVSVLGSVIRGSRLARVLGFPTANINPHHEVIPPPGIYAVRIMLEENVYDGVCYIGRRPTIGLKKSPVRTEVHIFDFHKDIYGRFMEIQFVKMIRPDKKFTSLNELAFQIGKDIKICRSILKNSS